VIFATPTLKGPIVGAFHKISVKNLDAYLQEQEFRVNNRNNQHAFRDVMKRILTGEALWYSALTASHHVAHCPAPADSGASTALPC